MDLFAWPSCVHFIGARIISSGMIISLIKSCVNKRGNLSGNSLRIHSFMLKFVNISRYAFECLNMKN